MWQNWNTTFGNGIERDNWKIRTEPKKASVMLEYELSPSCNGDLLDKQRSYIVRKIF